MASANDGGSGDNPTFQPFHIILKQVVEHLDEFPTHASVPRSRYSVPKLAAALLEHSLDPIALGYRLWDDLQRRSSGIAWRQLVAGLETQVDGDDGSAKIGTNGIGDMVDIIRSSAPVQLILFRWTDGYFHDIFQSMRQLSRSSAAPSSGNVTAHDPKFPRYLFNRDGPSCLTTGTIHLGAKQKDVDQWTKDFAAGQAIHMDTLEASHTVPFSIASDKRVRTRSHLAEFSGNTIREAQVTGDSINNPANGIMMEKGAHSAFGSYRFGIECTDVPNSPTPEYRVRFVHQNLPKSLDGCDGRILHFGQWETTREPDKLNYTNLPNPAYLRTHMAIAKVLHASGAGEVIDQIFREEDLLKEECRALSDPYSLPEDEDEMEREI